MGDSRILMRELHTTCHNTPSKSVFETPKKEVHCSVLRPMQEQLGRTAPVPYSLTACPASIKFTAASLSVVHQNVRVFSFSFSFSFLKVNENSPCLFKEKAYAPGHSSGKSYLAHWCAESSKFPQLELELSAGSKLSNTCTEQQRRRSEERREGDIRREGGKGLSRQTYHPPGPG